jgi:hypothetical protein
MPLIVFVSLLNVFSRETDEICDLLACYAAYNNNSLPTFRDNLSILFSSLIKLDFLYLEDGTEKLSLNVNSELPLYAT